MILVHFFSFQAAAIRSGRFFINRQQMTNPRYKFRAAELVTHLGHRVYQIKCIIEYILISFNLSMNHQFWTGQSKFCVRARASYSELEIYYLLTCISFTDEDANWFVINKPAGLTVHPCGLSC